MRNNIAIFLSALVIFGVVLFVGRKFKLSSRYERSPRTLDTWNALDKGLDPSDEQLP